MPVTSQLHERLIQMSITVNGQVQAPLSFLGLFLKQSKPIGNGCMGNMEIIVIREEFRYFAEG